MENVFFEIKDVSKNFLEVKALSHVSMTMQAGEVRALVGENGAGKSTLVKILNGNYKMDGGAIFIDGKEVEISNPKRAAELGISIIFQELNLVNGLSVAENIFAGRLSEKGRFINWKQIYEKSERLLDRIGFKVNVKTPVGQLSIAGKQMVEIAKALSYDSRIILMDEPSATLTQKELTELFSIIRDLKAKGIAVMYISHRLEEIFEICDSVSVMRDGNMIDTKPVRDINRDQIVEMMVGRGVSQTFPRRAHAPGDEVLRVEGLQQRGKGARVGFSLRAGEVLGIAGLVGSGRTETMRALFGVDYSSGGDVYVKGKRVKIASPRDAKRAGMAFLTEDRKKEGLAVDFSVRSNIVMAGLEKCASLFFLHPRRENAIAETFIRLIKIRTPSLSQKVLYLSGGNQQKVVVSKWLNANSDIIIMDEPTRGIDVGAKLEIYELINKMAGEGKAVIFISSELPEVLGMSDRVLVMKDDLVAAELEGEKLNAVEVMRYAL
ncbi:MAG: sugar ABC transporter ATP-binding protein [Treponema sp.]|jgi:ribose transport system ATP-binding protein|nr:sugar ABC transporter ATP-binding protein [Treponema sp.]